jgi:translation initiation factor IF-3
MKLKDALQEARKYDLDLVEVAPNANPPVCRILDYGKYKYELEQKLKRAKKHQSQIVIKEIKLRPKINRHDFEVKKKHVRRFLESGHKVKLFVWFRGREIVHPDIGESLLQKMAEEVSDLGTVETTPKMDGRRMIMVITPKKTQKEGMKNA